MSHFPLPAWEEHSVIIHKIPSLLSCKSPFLIVRPSQEIRLEQLLSRVLHHGTLSPPEFGQCPLEAL